MKHINKKFVVATVRIDLLMGFGIAQAGWYDAYGFYQPTCVLGYWAPGFYGPIWVPGFCS